MLPRFIRRIIAPTVVREADRLVEDHGPGAVFLARHAAQTARGQHAINHLHRVLAEVERRVGR